MKKIFVTMFLLAVTVILTAAFVSCSCGSDAPAVTSALTSSDLIEETGSAPATTGKTPVQTTRTTTATNSNLTVPHITTVGSTTATAPHSSSIQIETSTQTVKLPAKPIVPSAEKADDSGKISLSASEIKTGLLLDINENNPYDAQVNLLFNGDQNTTAEEAIKAGYTHISSMFRTVDLTHFLRNEAIQALAAMIQSFDAAAGTDKPFLVEGYTYASAAERLDSVYVTGNLLKLRVLSKDSVFPLNYTGNKVWLNGELVTYDKWFEANAATYGFIYEGLVGSENVKAGQLRYVGTIHSMGIKEAGSLEAYVEAIKAGTVTSATVAEDEWKLSYVKLSQGENIEHYTEIVVGANATYTISGDNKEGVIVAIKVEAAE